MEVSVVKYVGLGLAIVSLLIFCAGWLTDLTLSVFKNIDGLVRFLGLLAVVLSIPTISANVHYIMQQIGG
jgi:hypothetical protein